MTTCSLKDTASARTKLFIRHGPNGYRLAEQSDLVAGNKLFIFHLCATGYPTFTEATLEPNPVRSDPSGKRTVRLRMEGKEDVQTIEEKEVLNLQPELNLEREIILTLFLVKR